MKEILPGRLSLFRDKIRNIYAKKIKFITKYIQVENIRKERIYI